MGAAVATNKSTLFSTSEHGKTLLRKHVWAYSKTTIEVTSSFRDLGSHVNLAQTPFSSTLHDRIKETIAIIRRLLKLPLTHRQIAHQIRARCLPKALYGCEAMRISDSILIALTTAIKML